MNGILNKLGTTVHNSLIRRGRSRLREELLRQPARLLVDAGLSRGLLELGVEHYPWREATMAAVPQRFAPVPPLLVRRRAIRELQSLNDRDLHDLGITRGDIPRAVRAGRQSVELGRETNDWRHAA